MDEWLKQVSDDVKAIRPYVNTGDELISSMEANDYIISYPKTFKKKYWTANE